MLAPIEARLGTNPFDFLRNSWPGHIPWEGALYRLGIRRTAGPLAHPICLGFFYTMIIPAGLWLVHSKAISKKAGYTCLALCCLGLLLTVSRGPLLSMGVIILVMGIMAFSRWPQFRALSLVLSILATIGVASLLIAYASIDRDDAKNAAQESAAYRMELVDNYMPLLKERPWLGYGKDLVPVVDNQKSIDNQFLLMALQHGVGASLLNLMLLVAPMLMLLGALWKPNGKWELRAAGKMLITLLLAAAVTQLTVFSGPQTTQILLLFAGAAVTLAVRIRSTRVQGARGHHQVRFSQ
jgi:O-antigen ligase